MWSTLPFTVREHVTATLWIQSEPLTERKLNRSTLSMPKALSCRMTGAKLERCISGTVEAGSFSKSSSDKGTDAIERTGREEKREGRWIIMNNDAHVNALYLPLAFYSCEFARTRVQSKAFPRSVSPGSPRPLAGWSLGDGRDHQRFNGSARIVGSQLHECTVNDKYNSVYSDGGLSYVSCHHNLEEK